MDWIKGATDYCYLCCNFLNIFTDRFEELNTEVRLGLKIPIFQKTLVELEVRELPLKVDSWLQFSPCLSQVIT